MAHNDLKRRSTIDSSRRKHAAANSSSPTPARSRGAALAIALAAGAGLSTPPLVVIAVVAFDQFGGAVANATAAAKRRFHAPGHNWRHHLAFVTVHIQPFALGLVVPGFGWIAAAVIYGLVVTGAIVVLAAPGRLRRPVAFAR